MGADEALRHRLRRSTGVAFVKKLIGSDDAEAKPTDTVRNLAGRLAR